MTQLLTKPVKHIHTAPAVRVQDVSVHYETGYALRDISFALPVGEHLAVVGPNGAGKTTLFQVLAGLLKPTSGKVEIYGKKPGGHVCIAYVPQRSQVDWEFPVTVTEVVMMGRIRKLGFFNWPKKRDWDLVQQALETVDLIDQRKRQIGELSGGQQHRVFLAQALAQEAELILLDEPLTGLDLPSQEAIFRILEDFKGSHLPVVIATHDLDLAAQRFDKVMLLNREMISFGPPDESLSTTSLLDAYGAHLHIVRGENGVAVLTDPCADFKGDSEGVK
jgi:manganese/iron transport system ATP-binding protein